MRYFAYYNDIIFNEGIIENYMATPVSKYYNFKYSYL